MNSDDLSKGSAVAAPLRKRFHLAGPSVPLAAGRYAVRRDLAEMEVADRVFAQHYVEPWSVRVRSATAVRARPAHDADVVATLEANATFHLLDIGQDWAWGRGDATGSVGYVAASALDMS